MAMANLQAISLLYFLWHVIVHSVQSRHTHIISRHCPQIINGDIPKVAFDSSTSCGSRKTHPVHWHRSNKRLSPCIISLPIEVLVSWGFTGLAGAIVADSTSWMRCVIYVVIIYLASDYLDVLSALRILHITSSSPSIAFSHWHHLYRGGILYLGINSLTGKPLGNRAVFGVSWVFAGLAGWIAADIILLMGLCIYLMVRYGVQGCR